jgi:hypothetical protein
MQVGREAIRMIQLAGADEPRRVIACAEWTGLDGEDLMSACDVIQPMLQMGGFRGRHVTLSLPYVDLAVRSVNIASGDRQTPAATVEAVRDTLDEKQANSCYWPLAVMQPTASDGRSSVVLVQVARSCQEQWTQQLAARGALVACSLPRPLAAWQALQAFLRRRSDLHRTHVLIDTAADVTGVLVAAGPEPYLLKCIDIGEHQMVAAAAEHLGLDRQSIRRLCRRMQCDHAARFVEADVADMLTPTSDALAWALFDAVRETAETLVFEIGLCLKYCQTTFGAPAPAAVWLGGGEAAESIALRYLLHERLGVHVHMLEPLKGLDMSRSSLAEDRRGALAEWAPAVGAARIQAARWQNVGNAAAFQKGVAT